MILQDQIEFLKVWYALFCTIMDAHSAGEYSDAATVEKLRRLRNALVTRLPEIENAVHRVRDAQQSEETHKMNPDLQKELLARLDAIGQKLGI